MATPSSPQTPSPKTPKNPKVAGFLRIKLLNIELVTEAPLDPEKIKEPYCAVNIKESEGNQLVQVAGMTRMLKLLSCS